MSIDAFCDLQIEYARAEKQDKGCLLRLARQQINYPRSLSLRNIFLAKTIPRGKLLFSE